MFKNIYVNRKDNSFTLWETDGSKKTHKFKCRSWIENPGIENSSYRTIDDIPVMPVFKTCQDERFDVTNGNLRCEADIQPEIRILSEYYEKEETLDFNISDFNVLSFDIEVENGSGFPEPEKAERRVNVISCYSTKYKKFMIFSLNSVNRNRFHELVVDRAKAFEDIFEENSKTDKKGVLKDYFKSLDIVNNYIVIECPDEETLLSKFYFYCEEVRPDIYTSWNGNNFDLPYLVNRSKKLLVYEYSKLSPVGKVYLSQKKNEQFRTMELVPVICGASCIDYLPLYKEFNKGAQKINYKLDTIANDELKIGKVKLGDSGLSLAEKDWDSFCVYNLVDSVLVVLLEPQLQLIESLIGTCSEARIPLEYFFISKRVILGFMMTYMHRKGLVIPFTKNVPKEPYEGAYIKMNPKPYKYVASFDAKAMYPSIMISCNISPETKIVSTVELLDCCKSVIKNIYYNKEKQGIIPEIVSFIVDSRDEFKRLQKVYSNPEKKEYDPNKKALYERKQKAYKIFANSVYGLLGNNYFQLYDVHNAASITGIGNKLIQHVINYTVAWMDNKLPTNENFRKEFGEYANVTIKGKLDDSYVKSFDESERSMLGVYKRLVLAHTDSFFFDYSDLYSPFENRKRTWEEYIAIKERFTNTESPSYNKALASYFKDMNDRMWDTMTFTEFMLRFDYCVFEKIMSQITHKWSTMYNYREDRMWFKLEKCCTNLIALTKAHYICYLEYDEGDLLLHQPFKKRLKAVGVEMIKSDTPQWSKDKIMETLEQMFTKGNRNDISKYIGLLNKDYRDPKNLARISRPASINSLGPTLANTYPAPRMGSIIWNKILDEDSDFANYEPISEGTKIRWIAVKQPNKFNIPAISYNCEEYPQELKKYFIIDHDTQFKKTFRTPLEKIFEIYGWGNIFDGNVESIRRYFKQKG